MVALQKEIAPELLQSAHASALRCSNNISAGWNVAKFGQKGGGILTKLAGSSLEFHEHRAYTHGDDPRFIDWGASAKTGETFVKVFRDEVAPLLDIIIDVSLSMSVDLKKEYRTWELVYWIAEWGRSVGVTPQITLFSDQYRILSLEELLSYRVLCESRGLNRNPSPLLQQLPLRKNSFRIMVSDYLWPENPENTLRILQSGAVLFAPRSRSEEDPQWSGNIVLTDNEGSDEVHLSSDPSFLETYRSLYKRHFLMWNEAAVKSKITFLPVSSETDLMPELLSLFEQPTLSRSL